MRIAIVNDLSLAVETLRRAVRAIPGASVAWVAENGAVAVEKCAADTPDIVLMDMIMPVMDGVEATRRIMKSNPCPILVVTATVEGNADKVFESLGAGALDAVATPTLNPDGSVANLDVLIRKVHAIDLISARRPAARAMASQAQLHGSVGTAIAPMLLIGASTGGPEAIAKVLKSLPLPTPWPVIIVQHVDAAFAPGLANWLTRESRHVVQVAHDGDSPRPNAALIAATGDHLILDSTGRLRYVVEPRDQVYRPSVDVFFESVAAARASPGVAVVLTGMGRDGSSGLLRLRKAGWHTIVQDKATSVVWGMPAAALEAGAAVQTLAVHDVAASIVAHMTSEPSHSRRTA